LMEIQVMEQIGAAIISAYPQTAAFVRLIDQLGDYQLGWMVKHLDDPDLDSAKNKPLFAFLLRVARAEGAMDGLLDAAISEHPQNRVLHAALTAWKQEWTTARGLRELDPQSVYDQAHLRLQELVEPLIAIEALWDGDTIGWFVTLVGTAAPSSPARPSYCEYPLVSLRGSGGDLRVINGHVPPWPEAQVATEVGTRLADERGIPFYFASPQEPDDSCPRWWEQEQACICPRCGKLRMLQPPIGLCQRCVGQENHRGEET
jgi:hypothetical protein